MQQSKLVKVLLLVTGIIILLIFSFEVLNDYNYFSSKRNVSGVLKNILIDEKNNNYELEVYYYNDYLNKSIDCNIEVNTRLGRKLKESGIQTIKIIYPKNNPYDIYLVDYTHPNIGTFIIHCILFIIALFGTIIFIKNSMIN